MKESGVRQQLYRSLRLDGWWPITQTDASKCPRCKALVKPPIGRPDVLVLHPRKPASVLEVKTLRPQEKSFPFERITEEQRRWLDRWANAGGQGNIALAVLEEHGKRVHIDHLYHVPWIQWRRVEDTIKPIQNSIPFAAGKGMRTELQERQLDIAHLLAKWRITRQEGEWVIPFSR
jgi:hypothetical protein